jgi:hypothetical protein
MLQYPKLLLARIRPFSMRVTLCVCASQCVNEQVEEASEGLFESAAAFKRKGRCRGRLTFYSIRVKRIPCTALVRENKQPVMRIVRMAFRSQYVTWGVLLGGLGARLRTPTYACVRLCTPVYAYVRLYTPIYAYKYLYTPM